MSPLHEKLFRATTALNVTIIEDINGEVCARALIKGMRECQNQIAEVIAELAKEHSERPR